MFERTDEQFERFLQACEPVHAPYEMNDDAKISVHVAVSAASSAYEKLRTVIEYKDEHLVRVAAIERIVRRRLAMGDSATQCARLVVQELIAAKYIPNASVTEALMHEITPAIERLVRVRALGASSELEAWMRDIISWEIDEFIGDRGTQERVVQFIFGRVQAHVSVVGGAFDPAWKAVQVYIACERICHRADDSLLAYRLLPKFLSRYERMDEWDEAFMAQLTTAKDRIYTACHDPLSPKFLRAVKPWCVAGMMLKDVIEEKPQWRSAHALNDELLKAVEQRAEQRYAHAKARLRRGTVRSILYLFLSKMLLALALELPFEQWLYHTIHYTSLAINVFFPPVLMAFVGFSIRLPGKDNTQRILRAVEELFSEEGPKIREIRLPSTRSTFARIGMAVGYAISWCLTFGLVVWGLRALSFTPVSAAIFLFFLCVVSFFAYRLRMGARQDVVIRSKESVLLSLGDVLLLPILRAGKFLSVQISRVNIFVLLFDMIIEAPFKTSMHALEDIFNYLREKKDELE